MRIRSIKPAFWRSDDIDQLDWTARLVFIGLWSYVDDNGVGRDRLSDIVADLFAGDLSADPTETLRRVSTALDALQRGDLIRRYVVDNRAYIYITKWDSHQLVKNPNKPRFPLPTSDYSVPTEVLRTSSVEPPYTLPTVVEDKSCRGVEEKGSSSEIAVALADTIRPEVERICTHLADRIEDNGSKRPAINSKWRDSARLMLDKDGRTEQQVITAIDWCQNDEFWRGNILSVPKLREKYDQLRLAAERLKTTRAKSGDIDWEAAMQRAQDRDAHRQEIA